MSTSVGQPQDAVTIRVGPTAGDLGAVLLMHGQLYRVEHGLDEEFDAHVARGLAEFATAIAQARQEPAGPPAGWLWVAERDGQPVGTIALTHEGDGVGQVRWFLVAPAARGMGLGRRLLSALLDRARADGFRQLRLWTIAQLTTAARLYTEAGFRPTESHERQQWGQRLRAIRYELDLTQDRRTRQP